ncbi:hypothetical protein [Hansschlegelia sp.]|uniref:hypothetical protein n=1 Tax=Hansschlegelia sp. TaxID=2041892 RepID=UPI002D02258F|nr:hypothetical protein [Hansschlegelia sp.]HVI27590.1 hypothetical protein [Hansschlegelia sp.]
MPHPGNQRDPFATCRILRDVVREGPIVCHLGEYPVHSIVRDEWGRRYAYVGVVGACQYGPSACQELDRGEFLLPPGVIYRMEAGAALVGLGRHEGQPVTRSSRR